MPASTENQRPEWIVGNFHSDVRFLRDNVITICD